MTTNKLCSQKDEPDAQGVVDTHNLGNRTAMEGRVREDVGEDARTRGRVEEEVEEGVLVRAADTQMLWSLQTTKSGIK